MAQLPPDLVEASAEAKRLGIPYRTALNWWRRGILPTWKRGRRRFVRPGDLARVKARMMDFVPGDTIDTSETPETSP